MTDALRSPEAILAAMTRPEKLAQLQIIWRRDPAEAEALAREGIGALFWPGTAEESNEIQRIAREESTHGIPLLIGLDVVHGQFTIFPTPLAQAASFDLDVARADARISAAEARATGVNWTFSPMVDVSRDPRWGRVVEGFGEDAYLTSAFGTAKVEAYQDRGPDGRGGIASCLKHFVAYGAAEGGRDYNTTDVSPRRLRDVYLEPFRAGVAAGAMSVMAAFNSLNGRPMHAHRTLLTDVLKNEWAFAGAVVGDAEGVKQLIPHGIASDEAHADSLALEAGLDVVMSGIPLAELNTTQQLRVSDDRLDDAVLRILRIKERLGLFERSSVDAASAPTEPTEKTLATARWAAERCPVLVKNDEGALPVAANVRRVLLTGPYARSKDHLGAWVQHFAAAANSLDSALAEELPDIEWIVRDGCDFLEGTDADLQDAEAAANTVDLILIAVGEPSSLSGEASSRSDIRLPDAQERLIDTLLRVGKPAAVVLMTGRPLIIESWIDQAETVLIAWHLGTEGPRALARLISGRLSPAGRLPMSFPRSVGQIPVHHDHEPTGRPATQRGSLAVIRDDVALAGPGNLDDYYTSKYLDLDLGPRLPFGHGLSYTTFELGEISLDMDTLDIGSLDSGATVTATVTVRNVGKRTADSVLMLFISDLLASLSQPVQRLRGFERVTLEPGESRNVDFTVDRDALGFWDDDATFTVEPGQFDIRVSDGAAIASTALIISEKTPHFYG